ncbi:hypothetical protein K523DRAFT_412203 [Schizophyllum commune Tattone D]|nr:hypothetical protein K523DRAFT_412203 [Schizophyllum commune Tattone D]
MDARCVMPALRTLKLENRSRNVANVPPWLPWRNIAELQTISNTSFALMGASLCVCLVRWTHRGTEYADIVDSRALVVTTHNHLQELYLYHIDARSDASTRMLDYITAPLLETASLSWHTKCLPPAHASPVPSDHAHIAFLQRSQRSLRKLTLESPLITLPLDYLSPLRDLRSLCLHWDARSTQWRHITDLGKSTVNGGPDLFPGLEELELGGYIRLNSQAVALLVSAREVVGHPIQLLDLDLFHVDVDNFWEERDLDRLRRLVPRVIDSE